MDTFEILPGVGEREGAMSPLVVSVPHAGTLIPAEDAPLLALEGPALLRDADLFVDRLCGDVPALGVTLVRARVSRYVLDVNRAPDDVDRDVCADFDRPTRVSARGLVWRITTDGAPVLKRPLSRAELEDRIRRIHAPYHEALGRLLEERRARFGFAVLLDAHSMPSTGRPGHSDPGARRADIVPGDVRGASCAPSVTRLLIEHFEAQRFQVRPNDPYMGGFITRHHGRPARGVHAIQLEMNRDLYMDEDALRFDDAKAAKLVPHLMSLVSKLKSWKP
jgi:N-formylglutamate amidohydrolase